MKARDIMVSPVITVKPDTSIEEVARLFLDRRISGAPVVDDRGSLVGIISEGDLLFRAEIGTERPHPYWFLQSAGEEILAAEYVKARARRVADVMTRKVVTATPDASLSEIAALLEAKFVKRLPIVEDGQLIGIVTRVNLIQALASAPKVQETTPADTAIRSQLLRHLSEQRWAHKSQFNVIVHDGVVDLWGETNSEAEKVAIRVAAESMPGVRAVNDHLLMRRREAPPKTERDITTR